MSDQPDNLILNMLRAIRSDMAEMKMDIIEIKQRLGMLEMQYANLSIRVDRLVGDMEMVKRRLDLADA